MIVPKPHPYNKQEGFWIWFNPCCQINQDLADPNDLYKYLNNEWFDDDVMESDDYKYYRAMPSFYSLLSILISQSATLPH